MRNEIAGVPARMMWGAIFDRHIPDFTTVDNFGVAFAKAMVTKNYEPSAIARPLKDFEREILEGLCHIRGIPAEAPVKEGYILRSFTTHELLVAMAQTDFLAEETAEGVVVFAHLRPGMASLVSKKLRQRGFR